MIISIVKFFDSGDGDMSYIYHNSDNFSIIDCNLPDDYFDRNKILDELEEKESKKQIFRFISTHPDEDHFHGLKDINNKLDIINFYCVKNDVNKEDITDDFKEYKKLRNSSRTFYIHKNATRRWMNMSTNKIGSAGINILWPDVNNYYFKEKFNEINNNDYASPNDISPIIKYSVKDNANIMFMGDIETDFLKKINDDVDWPSIDVLLAPHHGRKSGHIPYDILNKLNPKLIILGHAPSKDMDYYSNWNTILKNNSGDITLDCSGDFINVWVKNDEYTSNISFNNNENKNNLNLNYLGSIKVN
ncbi:hypothetical protein WR164_01850 [Philodulcilactobacillus myokoensis]|uniref:Metallo-beta-lactamase domain-containing protein n=1 Tax=Philodulcilactobacillus myokoensis TaxID=2929573 RepID=A0A9W6EQS7_9LACO|nr:hypothetical protein [Philodulcilactobacillus myokoensis]GLB46206.1 hypothetical protein WR164_01850 [Philodulcilactobacillus myokoensis]